MNIQILYRSNINYLTRIDLYVTNLPIFKMHGMSQKQILKSMDIAFLALLEQLLKVGHFITGLEKIDMNNRPLLSATLP